MNVITPIESLYRHAQERPAWLADHHIVLVIKSGRVYDPARIKQALGILPSRR